MWTEKRGSKRIEIISVGRSGEDIQAGQGSKVERSGVNGQAVRVKVVKIIAVFFT